MSAPCVQLSAEDAAELADEFAEATANLQYDIDDEQWAPLEQYHSALKVGGEPGHLVPLSCHGLAFWPLHSCDPLLVATCYYPGT